MTDVSAEKFDTICRLCTSSLAEDGAYEIFADSADSPKSICRKITNCLQLKVEKNDQLPQSICKNCVLKLDEYYSYRELCIQNEIILSNCIRNAKPLESRNRCKLEDAGLQSESSKDDVSNEKTKFPQFNNEKHNDVSPKGRKESPQDHLSDVEMSPNGNVGMSEDDDEEELEEEKDNDGFIPSSVSAKPLSRCSLPELAEPSPEDYVLMKEETFNLDPVKEMNSRGGSSILADYLIEFSNSKNGEHEIKDKDVLESQRLRREILPPMWDVYEKSIIEKENIAFEGGANGEKERLVTVTHRRYIINKGAFPCSLCGDCFEFDQGKKRDDFTEEKSKLYDCMICGKVFPRRSSWKRHQSTHEDIKPYVCRQCNKGFNRKEHLSRHLLSHSSVRPYGCTVCGKQFVRKEHLTRHQMCNPACAVPVDSVLRPFGCDVCNQGFVRKEHLIRHRKRAHDLDPPEGETEPKPFTCTICTKTFTRREHLKRHQLIHQREFTSSALGNMTMSAGARLFANATNCKDSEVSIFPTSQILPEITLSEIASNESMEQGGGDGGGGNHMNDSNEMGDGSLAADDDSLLPHYSMANEEDVEMEDDSEEPLPPIPVLEMNVNAANVPPTVVDIGKSSTFCNVCFKNFSRRSHLLRHMKRIHLMQLPPSNRRKSQQVQLVPKSGGDENGNSLTDGGAVGGAVPDPAYKCRMCARVFTRKSHLERHEKNIHQLDKEANQPYECVTCGETFVQSKSLDKHMQVHGNTVPENYVWM